MAGAKDTNARVTRWFLALQDFRFKVDHRPGREHANADALSRRDTCQGGFPVYRRPEQAVRECGIPPLKPRSRRVRGWGSESTPNVEAPGDPRVVDCVRCNYSLHYMPSTASTLHNSELFREPDPRGNGIPQCID